MAKTLAERITSAKSTDRVTITDLETLIADATAERDRLAGSAEHHDEESTNYALSDDDREEASRLAGHYQRTARGLTKEIDALTEKLEEKRSSEKRKAEEARIAAIIGRRDDLAARLKDRLPKMIDEMIALFTEIEDSDAEMIAAGIREPSAEAVARGVQGNFYQNYGPVPRFTKMKIPGWQGGKNVWPIDRNALAMAAMDRENHRRLLERKKAEREEAARWSHYVIDPPQGNDEVVITTDRGRERVRNRMQRKMTAEGVEEARKAGLHVVALKPGERLGQPIGMATIV